ncbi:MAG TPA: hypothetical protein VGF95_15770 [Solirubrobacteraceae bacterium]|jgi:predicted lipoprotein with Yx(FWY)xxD motif
MSKLSPALLLPVACALTLAACGSGEGEAGSIGGATNAGEEKAGEVSISSAPIKGLGSVLVDAQGRTLYMFPPDGDKQVTCVGSCAETWPPASLSSGEKPIATGAVKQSLLGSDPDPEGGRVITYAGWPLYTYAADVGPGSARGQGLDVSGGLWYVISPSGDVIKTKP